jgi:hypothetical protein
MGLTEALVLIAAAGVVAATAGLLVRRRGASSLRVELSWEPPLDPDQLPRRGTVYIANRGRRPIHVASVVLWITPGVGCPVPGTDPGGTTLAEGSAPLLVDIPPDFIDGVLAHHAVDWRLLRASVWDSAGKEWVSAAYRSTPTWEEERDRSVA